jgi:hypothetical protein
MIPTGYLPIDRVFIIRMAPSRRHSVENGPIEGVHTRMGLFSFWPTTEKPSWHRVADDDGSTDSASGCQGRPMDHLDDF